MFFGFINTFDFIGEIGGFEHPAAIILVTFSLKICIEKHGEIDGKEMWLNRQEKWIKNYNCTNERKSNCYSIGISRDR